MNNLFGNTCHSTDCLTMKSYRSSLNVVAVCYFYAELKLSGFENECLHIFCHACRCLLLSSSVVIVNNFSNIFFSETTAQICMKLTGIMNVPQSILHKMTLLIFDRFKNMATVAKNRTQGSDSRFLHISPKLLGLANF